MICAIRNVGWVSMLMIAVLMSLAAQARAGGKAEPLPIIVENGGATFEGRLAGDVQFELLIAARQGQWMMLEIASTPVDAAVFTVREPGQSETPAQYRWSRTLTATGDYLISVSKPAAYQKPCNFTLTVTLGSPPAAMKYSATDRESAALYAAMRRFINSLDDKDRAAFLSCFARSTSFAHLNPQNIGSARYYRRVVPYAELAADINRRRGWYWTYLERGENGNLDAFVDNVADSAMWQRVKGNKFVPPGAPVTSSIYVKWRKQGKRWVVDEISYPTA